MLKQSLIQNLKGIYSIGIIFLIWGLLIVTGTYQLLTYEYAPGSDTNFPITWPNKKEVNLATSGFTIVMVVHPKCSCSEASIGELSKLVARFPNILHAKILFVISLNADQNWKESDNWIAANEIPGAEVKYDIDGKLTKIFNLKTSGSTLLYNSKGELLFSGGITASRGHWGDNTGTQAISDIITKGSSDAKATAVFGCKVFNRN